jgi:DNA-binding IclR family transcriptional regulator
MTDPEPDADVDPVHSPGGRTVKGVETACRVLEALRELDGAGVTEVADHVGVSKATAHGHLTTLYKHEFVARDGDDYRVSLRFVDFGEHAKNGVEIHEVATQEVDKLADRTGEVAQYMVEEHGRGVYLHKARGADAVQTASYTGNRKRLHCTALGKAILAHLSEARVRAIADRHGLPEATPATITDVETLLEELATIRERGVAFDDEEILQGLRCVAAPITGQDGDLFGAISVSGPVSRIKGARFREELPELVSGAANVIEINAHQV